MSHGSLYLPVHYLTRQGRYSRPRAVMAWPNAGRDFARTGGACTVLARTGRPIPGLHRRDPLLPCRERQSRPIQPRVPHPPLAVPRDMRFLPLRRGCRHPVYGSTFLLFLTNVHVRGQFFLRIRPANPVLCPSIMTMSPMRSIVQARKSKRFSWYAPEGVN